MGGVQSLLQNEWITVPLVLVATYFASNYFSKSHRRNRSRSGRRGRRVQLPSRNLTPLSGDNNWKRFFASDETRLIAHLKSVKQEVNNNTKALCIVFVEHSDRINPNEDSNSVNMTNGSNSIFAEVWPTKEFLEFLNVNTGVSAGVKVSPLRLLSSSDDGKFVLDLAKSAGASLNNRRSASTARPPVILVVAGNTTAVIPCENQNAGSIMSQLEMLKKKTSELAQQLGAENFKNTTQQRLQALEDMLNHYTVALLVKRGIINPGDVVIERPDTLGPVPQANSNSDIERVNRSGAVNTHSTDNGVNRGSAGQVNLSSQDDDAVAQVQRFLLREEQERALRESLAADRAKAAKKKEEEARLLQEKRQREMEEERRDMEEEAKEAATLWAKMNKEHLRESFEAENEKEAQSETNQSKFKFSLVLPKSGRRVKCSLLSSSTIRRLAEYAYAYSTDDEGITHEHLDESRISFLATRPRKCVPMSDQSLIDAGLCSGILLRVILGDD